MNQKHRILILEGNARSRARLVALVTEAETNAVVFEAACAKEAESIAYRHRIDLFLLDAIENADVPNDIGGMRFAENLRKHATYRITPIVFVSSLADPKLYAYSTLHCYQYVEKPFDERRLVCVLREILCAQMPDRTYATICFRTDGVLVPVRKNEILYLVCEKPIIKVVCEAREVKIGYRPMIEMEKELADGHFSLCNRSTIVNMDKISSIDPVNQMIALMGNKTRLHLGTTYKERLLAGIGEMVL